VFAVIGSVLASTGFSAPNLDYHALAPEIVLVGGLVVLLLLDLVLPDRSKWATSTVSAMVLVGALVPILTLARDGATRSMLDSGYVVDDFALVMKGLLLVAGVVVVLISANYVEEGDYYQGEYYFLLVSSILGMVAMASARDLIMIFVALETLSIPAYLLAGWRKRDNKSNEASLKYYLLGVVASAIMLYGMSLIYGATGETNLFKISTALSSTSADLDRLVATGVILSLLGFAFKVSAVPFHQWAPDTYEGAPTPITAFLSVASKTAGFVALLELAFVAFGGQTDSWGPLMWVLSALTMTVGNLIALRQTNVVRMLAYSSVAQAGYILVPFAVAGNDSIAGESSMAAVAVYVLAYAFMNLGAFAVVIAVSRKTRSGEITSFGGLFEYAPGLAVLMTLFLAALIGIPPTVGFAGKLWIMRSIFDSGSASAVAIGVVLAVNTAIAAYYYLSVAREMWMKPVVDGDRTPIRVPQTLAAAMVITALGTIILGILPQLLGRLGDASVLVKG
jgi:NADH-quinone oxidoreductase subunit N